MKVKDLMDLMINDVQCYFSEDDEITEIIVNEKERTVTFKGWDNEQQSPIEETYHLEWIRK